VVGVNSALQSTSPCCTAPLTALNVTTLCCSFHRSAAPSGGHTAADDVAAADDAEPRASPASKLQRRPLAAKKSVRYLDDTVGEDEEKKGEDEIDMEPFRSTNSAGYRGVCWDGGMRKYNGRIRVNGRNMHLGYFDTATEAARAYAKAYLREKGRPPAPRASGKMAQQKALASSENDVDDEEDEASSSLRPAKRARVETAEESRQAPPASAPASGGTQVRFADWLEAQRARNRTH
jgi:hypothetical protein